MKDIRTDTRQQAGASGVDRRSFMRMAGMRMAGLGAGAMALGAGSSGEASAALPETAGAAGYRETDHIRSYYRHLRF